MNYDIRKVKEIRDVKRTEVNELLAQGNWYIDHMESDQFGELMYVMYRNK